MEPKFTELRRLSSNIDGKTDSGIVHHQILELEMIKLGHGLHESHWYINWAKLFLAEAYLREGQAEESIHILEQTIHGYIRTLDGDEYHPFLERFYQMLGNIYTKKDRIEKAKETFQKLLKCKERLHGEHSKEAIATLQHL